MIVEYVVCDWCTDKEPLDAGLVPSVWYSHDGRHYCTDYCLARADRNVTLAHWPSVKVDA